MYKSINPLILSVLLYRQNPLYYAWLNPSFHFSVVPRQKVTLKTTEEQWALFSGGMRHGVINWKVLLDKS
jgi:hypothetical protein